MEQQNLNLQAVSLQDFTNLCASAYEKKKEADKLKAQLEEISSSLEEQKIKIMEYMEQLNLEKFSVPNCGTLYLENKFSIKMPKDLEDKKALFKYLNTRGILYEYLTINHNSLNAFYDKELEIAKEKGNVDFSIPGVGEPQSYKLIKMRSK